MTQCTSRYTWRQGRGPADPKRGRVYQCILTEGHAGPCVYEGHATPARTAPAPVAGVERAPYVAKTQAEHDEAYREMVRRRARR